MQKMYSFLFCEFQLITVLLLIYDFLYEPKHKFLLSKTVCVGFFIFDSTSFLSKFIILFNKMYGLFNFKTS